MTHTKYYFENALIATTGILIIFFGFLVAGAVNNKGAEIVIEQTYSSKEKTIQETVPADKPSSTAPETTPLDLSAGSVSVLVNKKNSLPSDYVPTGLRRINGENVSQAILQDDAASAFESLLKSASLSGIDLKVISAYRSYSEQVAVFNNYVAQYGVAEAETFSARPGYSEHQTGLAVDVGAASSACDLDECFADTAEGKWVAQNAHLFGFIVRYRKNDSAITGYQFEPWHLRFLGNPLASEVNASGLSYEEYLGKEGGNYE